MYFDENGILMVQKEKFDYWTEESYMRYRGAWWFPLNWITIPLAAYRRKLKEMQSIHYDE